MFKNKKISIALFIALPGLVLIGNLIRHTPLMAFIGIPFPPSYFFESTDRKYACTEVPSKYDLSEVEGSFEKYKERSGNREAELCRTSKRNIFKFYEWWDYLTNPRWKYPYMEPSEKPNYGWADQYN